MLKYRVNRRKFNKTKVDLEIENISFVDFENLLDEEDQPIDYDGDKVGKIMVTCECVDIDKMKNGSFISTINTLTLNFGTDGEPDLHEFVFDKDYQVNGVNKENNSFSILIDKNFILKPQKIEKFVNIEDTEEDNIYFFFEDYHYFDVNDNFEGEKQEIPVYFRYFNKDGEFVTITIKFRYYTPYILVTSYNDFDGEEERKLFNMIFKPTEEETYTEETNSQETVEGDLSNIEIYRDKFLFGEKTIYQFTFERPLAELNVPIVNTFETTLFQMELLNEQFVEAEKKKAINRITDLEKDIYYPCISNTNQSVFTDVYNIKFNLHFREHRGDDWLVENESFWNCVELDNNGKARIVNNDLTKDNMSDLLSFLGFTNNDVHYQKNKLKKSFLRLMYFDSTNPANQNMIGYSTIFFDTGDLFAKYIRYIEEIGYTAVNADKNNFGKYTPSPNKVGIRVDRESWNDETRLSSQLVIKNKNLSKASSEGFYLYIWKDNEMALPQDLYMKVEFNHAGYGRTIPFMMPYWDKRKWPNKDKRIKKFTEILNDWNSEAENGLDSNKNVVWRYNGQQTDGHYGIRQYTKFSYIHLKYKYDKENDKHIYYLDPDTYGNIEFPTDESGNKYIEINLYEAKVE